MDRFAGGAHSTHSRRPYAVALEHNPQMSRVAAPPSRWCVALRAADCAVTRDTSYARAHAIYISTRRVGIGCFVDVAERTLTQYTSRCTVRIDDIVVVRTDGAPLVTLLDTTVMEHCAQRNVLLESTKKFAVCLGARALLYEVHTNLFICTLYLWKTDHNIISQACAVAHRSAARNDRFATAIHSMLPCNGTYR